MDNKSPNQNFHDCINKELLYKKLKEISQFLEKEIMEHEFEEVDEWAFSQIYQSFEYELANFEKSTKSIYQDFENEFMNDELEEVDELAVTQICQSLENEIQEVNKMHLSALNQQVVDQIQSLEDEGMINSQFRGVYSLKKDRAPSFFRNLVIYFFRDARATIRNLIATLESSTVVDFDFLNKRCLTLKGGSGCIGACTLNNGCSVFLEAVDKKSKDECLQAARNLNQVYHELHAKLKSLMKLEKEIVAAEKNALGQLQ